MFYPQQNMNFYNPEINNMYLNSNPFYNNSFPVSETNKKFISNNPVTGNPTISQVNMKDKEFFREDLKGKACF